MDRRTKTKPAGKPAGALAAWHSAVARARQSDRDALPDALAPPEAFSDRRGNSAHRARCGRHVPDTETGRNSRMVTSRLRMSCAGWRKVPTAAEFYTAVHDPAGSDHGDPADVVSRGAYRRAGPRATRRRVQLARTGASAAPRRADSRTGGTPDQPVHTTMSDNKKPVPETPWTKGRSRDILEDGAGVLGTHPAADTGRRR